MDSGYTKKRVLFGILVTAYDR